MRSYGKEGIVIIVFAALFCFDPFSARSFNVDEMALKDLDIRQPSLTNGDVVSGSFLIENNTGLSADLDYEITLFQRKKIYDREKFIIDDQIQSEDSKIQDFKFELPRNIGSGEYILRVQLFSRSGYAFNWEEEDLHIEGGGTYLSITDSYMLKDGTRFNSAELPEYYSGETPQAILDVYNPKDEPVVITQIVLIGYASGWLISPEKVSGIEYTIAPKKNEKIKIDLLGAEKIETYFAEIELARGDENISSIERFGWKVIKKEAKIVSVGTKDGLFRPGKENLLSVQIAGYSDKGETENVRLSVEVQDTFGKLLQRKEKEIKISLGDTFEEIVADIDTEVPNLRVVSVLSRNGKILDSNESIIPVKIERKAVKKDVNLSYFWIFLIAILAITAIIIVINFAKIRKLLEK